MSPRQTAPLALEHVLLALLDSHPMHGYELYQALSQTQGIVLVWNITQSLLYALLDKLEDHGLLAADPAQTATYPPRKILRVTAAGRQALEQWLNTPVSRPRQMRQEFLAKLIVARRYGPAAALALIHAQQQACQTWLQQLQADFPPKDAGHMDTWLVDSYRVHRLKALIQWLALCEAEIIGELPPA